MNAKITMKKMHSWGLVPTFSGLSVQHSATSTTTAGIPHAKKLQYKFLNQFLECLIHRVLYESWIPG